ncbi:MAG: hypothetical protein CSA62_13895 [Planctomycetota bacterium]|nr:MAG: hypothetical protein CSA62_13895 [Planctomycetota bacterium]
MLWLLQTAPAHRYESRDSFFAPSFASGLSLIVSHKLLPARLRGYLHLFLGKFWLKTGRMERARPYFESAAACGADEFGARVALARIELEAGRLGPAKEQVGLARRCNPERFLSLEDSLRSAWSVTVEETPRASSASSRPSFWVDWPTSSQTSAPLIGAARINEGSATGLSWADFDQSQALFTAWRRLIQGDAAGSDEELSDDDLLDEIDALWTDEDEQSFDHIWNAPIPPAEGKPSDSVDFWSEAADAASSEPRPSEPGLPDQEEALDIELSFPLAGFYSQLFQQQEGFDEGENEEQGPDSAHGEKGPSAADPGDHPASEDAAEAGLPPELEPRPIRREEIETLDWGEFMAQLRAHDDSQGED